MSTVIADKKFTRFQVINVVGTLMIALSLLSLFILDDAKYKLSLQKEMNAAKELLSVDDWKMLEEKIQVRHKKHYYENGLYDVVVDTFLPKKAHFTDVIANEKYLYRLVNNISIFSFQISYRVTTMEYWLALLVPFMICIIYHGFTRWRINRYRVGGANTSFARIYLKAVWMFGMSLFLMFTLPNYIASLGVFMPAVILVGMAAAISLFISSYQKDI